jgi:hypothetical protein
MESRAKSAQGEKLGKTETEQQEGSLRKEACGKKRRTSIKVFNIATEHIGERDFRRWRCDI